jgi:hypothetical protein
MNAFWKCIEMIHEVSKIYKMAPYWIGRHFETIKEKNCMDHLRSFPKCIHFLKSGENCIRYRPETD